MTKAENVTVEATITSGKPGVKTSEFWKSLVVHVVAMLVIALGAYRGSDMLAGVGSILLGMSNGSYNISRGNAKKVVSIP